VWLCYVVSTSQPSDSDLRPRECVLMMGSYICRVDIRAVGYKHFCQHFRQVPGTACTDCDACDLYANEDEAAAIRNAAKAAEQEYYSRYGHPGGNKEKVVSGRRRWWEGVMEWVLEWGVERGCE
jgi:hypothetical protein